MTEYPKMRVVLRDTRQISQDFDGLREAYHMSPKGELLADLIWRNLTEMEASRHESRASLDVLFDSAVRVFCGKGIPITGSAGVGYFKLLTDQGHAYAQHNSGFCLLHGEIVRRNESEAAHYLQLSADHGLAEARYALLLLKGIDHPPKESAAPHSFKLAADQAHASTQENYGSCLVIGRGIPMDESTPRVCFICQPIK
jgi:TPR repeat protein